MEGEQKHWEAGVKGSTLCWRCARYSDYASVHRE